MAEVLLGGILREDEEAPAVRAPEALAGPEAFAADIADHDSIQSPEAARQLAALLTFLIKNSDRSTRSLL